MKDKKKAVYVLLTDTGTVLNRIIKWFTNAPYNHASIAFDEHLKEIYSFGRKQPKNPLFAGFVREDVYYGTYRYFQNTRCLLLKMEVTEEQFEKIRNTIKEFEKNKDQYSYNLIGLIGVLFNFPIGKKNSYFCSQFVSEVFRRSGIRLWNQPSALVQPNDFIMHHRFEFVYEGRLYDYPKLDQELIAQLREADGYLLERSMEALKRVLPH